jgi:hypothetical protein
MSHLGVGVAGASGLYEAYKRDPKLGDLEKKLGEAGISIDGMNPNRIGTLASAVYGSDGDLRKQAKNLLGLKGADALTPAESKALNEKLAAKNEDELRKIVLALTNTHDLTKDQGQAQRDIEAQMNAAMQDLVKNLIPLTLTIKEGIVELVDVVSLGNSSWARNQKKASDKDRTNNLSGQALDDEIQSVRTSIADYAKKSHEGRPEDREYEILNKPKNDENIARLEAQREAQKNGTYVNPNDGDAGPSRMGPQAPVKARSGMKLSDEQLAYLLDTDRQLGATPGTSAAQIQVESGNDPNAVSSKGAWGLSQLIPSTKRSIEKRLGHKIITPSDQLEAHRYAMKENLREFGNLPDALRAYNGGWNPLTWGNKETAAYVGKINSARDMMPADAKVPGGINPGSRQFEKQQVEVSSNSNIFLFDGVSGKMLNNVAIQTHNRLPSYSGSAVQ